MTRVDLWPRSSPGSDSPPRWRSGWGSRPRRRRLPGPAQSAFADVVQTVTPLQVPDGHSDFGKRVSDDAKDGGVDGQEISSEAKQLNDHTPGPPSSVPVGPPSGLAPSGVPVGPPASTPAGPPASIPAGPPSSTPAGPPSGLPPGPPSGVPAGPPVAQP